MGNKKSTQNDPVSKGNVSGDDVDEELDKKDEPVPSKCIPKVEISLNVKGEIDIRSEDEVGEILDCVSFLHPDDNQWRLITCKRNGFITLINLETYKVEKKVSCERNIFSLALHNFGPQKRYHFLSSSHSGGRICFWCLYDITLLKEFKVNDDLCKGLIWKHIKIETNDAKDLLIVSLIYIDAVIHSFRIQVIDDDDDSETDFQLEAEIHELHRMKDSLGHNLHQLQSMNDVVIASVTWEENLADPSKRFFKKNRLLIPVINVRTRKLLNVLEEKPTKPENYTPRGISSFVHPKKQNREYVVLTNTYEEVRIFVFVTDAPSLDMEETYPFHVRETGLEVTLFGSAYINPVLKVNESFFFLGGVDRPIHDGQSKIDGEDHHFPLFIHTLEVIHHDDTNKIYPFKAELKRKKIGKIGSRKELQEHNFSLVSEKLCWLERNVFVMCASPGIVFVIEFVGNLVRRSGVKKRNKHELGDEKERINFIKDLCLVTVESNVGDNKLMKIEMFRLKFSDSSIIHIPFFLL